MKTTFHDIDQNSDEWFEMRAGKVTSSQISKVMANFGKSFGDPAKKYAEQIALERVTKKRAGGDNFQSEAMKRGHELEPVARNLYEKENVCFALNGGFFESECGKLGDSPDGLVQGAEKFPIEIKSVYPAAHWERIKKGGIPSAYKWQVQFHIWLTGASFCDFISYCPDFPKEKQLYTCRVPKDETMIAQMQSRLTEFEKLVEENISLLTDF